MQHWGLLYRKEMSESHKNAQILIFLRVPEKGKVKTRLSRILDEKIVLGLYRCFVEDTLDTMRACGYTIIPCYFPSEGRQTVTNWLGTDFQYRPQRGNDLGERMACAFQDAFSSGCTRAILIGTDFPDLNTRIIHEAMENLCSHDVVLGPAKDGGYYLIGFRSDTFTRQAFQNIPWGESTVLRKTLTRLEQCGLTRHLLPEWRDIDRYEDLYRFWQQITDPPASAPRSCRFLSGRCLPPIPPDMSGGGR